MKTINYTVILVTLFGSKDPGTKHLSQILETSHISL